MGLKCEKSSGFLGDVYQKVGVQSVPFTLNEAIRCFEESEWVRRTFGDKVVEHYLHFFRTEQKTFDQVVTDWERSRYFERA